MLLRVSIQATGSFNVLLRVSIQATASIKAAYVSVCQLASAELRCSFDKPDWRMVIVLSVRVEVRMD